MQGISPPSARGRNDKFVVKKVRMRAARKARRPHPQYFTYISCHLERDPPKADRLRTKRSVFTNEVSKPPSNLVVNKI
jgi:hypothetical protein